MELYNFITSVVLEELPPESEQTNTVEALLLFPFGFFVLQIWMGTSGPFMGFAKSPMGWDGGHISGPGLAPALITLSGELCIVHGLWPL